MSTGKIKKNEEEKNEQKNEEEAAAGQVKEEVKEKKPETSSHWSSEDKTILRNVVIISLVIILIALVAVIGIQNHFLNSYYSVSVKIVETAAAETTQAPEVVTTTETSAATTEGTVVIPEGTLPNFYYSLGSIPTSTKEGKIRNSGELWIDVTWEEIVSVTGSDANAYFSKNDVINKIYSVKGGTDIGTINLFTAEDTSDNQSAVYFLDGLYKGSNCEMGWLFGRRPTEIDMLTVLYDRFNAMFFDPVNGEHGTGCKMVTGDISKGNTVLYNIKLTKEEFEKMTLDEFIQKFLKK